MGAAEVRMGLHLYQCSSVITLLLLKVYIYKVTYLVSSRGSGIASDR